ncbi:MAG: glycerophosphodiester phosphodiesterase family protein [Hyphomonas sp.]|uniref:glycerophosphodiester phosphodiesterase family protein n=1 Tax=Hyphomonas sp. TaxID=87 RepID=UPI003526E5F8
MKYRPILLAAMVAGALGAYLFWPVPRTAADFHPLSGAILIAHAGGGLPEGTYSNSREAFDRSGEAGFQLIEADFNWTRDGGLVLIHDWQEAHLLWFGAVRRAPAVLDLDPFTQAKTEAAFARRRMHRGLTPMTVADLSAWMEAHPDVRIVTDIKERNLEGLARLSETNGQFRDRFIPQIYTPEEYGPVRDLGFSQIIFTAYRSRLSAGELAEFAATHDLFALTVPAGSLAEADIRAITGAGTPVLMHTVNDPAAAEALLQTGVSGLYTDYLYPAPATR